MAKKEKIIIDSILKSMKENERFFRINAGRGWSASRTDTIYTRENNGSLTIRLRNARPLNAAPQGWPDLVGWRSIEITQEMVGQKIAVFCGVEVKTCGKIKPGSNQDMFAKCLKKMGGIFEERKS